VGQFACRLCRRPDDCRAPAAEAAWAAPPPGPRSVLVGWAAFLALSTLAALVSPNGIDALLLPSKLFGMNFALASIAEWRSVDFSTFDPLEVWIGLVILGG
jgi:hypothetical protein